MTGRVIWLAGATGVIGAATAHVLAARGATLALSGRNEGTLAAVGEAVQAAGGRALVYPLDIRNEAAVAETARRIVRDAGGIDALVNSMAAAVFGAFESLSDAAWAEVLDTKLMGYVRTMRAVLPHMTERGEGSIVNVSGRGGRQPTPAHLPGGCANAAINLLTKGVADAYWSRGIRANVVAPGPVQSDRFDLIESSNVKAWGGVNPRAALDRRGMPLDMANAIDFLLSPAARHITGVVLPVDGGGTATV